MKTYTVCYVTEDGRRLVVSVRAASADDAADAAFARYPDAFEIAGVLEFDMAGLLARPA